MRTYKKHSKKSRTYKKYGGAIKTIKYKNGNVYVGETIERDGKVIKHGNGKMKYKRRARDNDDTYVEYVGNWKDDMKDGFGEMEFYNTELYEEDDYLRYSGNWVNDNINGLGKMIFVSGNVYNGSWKDQQMSGTGEMTYANTYPEEYEDYEDHTSTNYSKYNGEWINGVKNGNGKMLFTNGDVYNGQWDNDYISGLGRLTYSSNNPNNYAFYSGSWDNDSKNGAGSLVFTDGRLYEGNWEDDEPLCDDYPDTHIDGDWGNTTWKCVDPDFRQALLEAEREEEEDEEDADIAVEIHRRSAKINLEKYVELIDTDKDNSENYGNIVSYIRPKFEAFIREYFQSNEKQLSLLKLNAVLDKFSSAREISEKPGNIKLIGKTIDFVFSQPKEFIDFYIHVFIKDCYHAYRVDNDDENQLNDEGMSCIGGILERFYMLVGESAFAMCPGEDCDNPKYVELLEFFRKRLDKNDLTQLWANTYLESEELKNMSLEERKQHYIEFMQKNYRENDLLDEITEKMINDEAKKLEDAGIFERLELGGNRRKTIKKTTNPKSKPKNTRGSKKIGKTKKSKK